MNKKQLIGSVLGGLFAIGTFFMYLKDVFMKKYAINVDLGFSDIGGIFDSVILIVLIFIATIFGALVAGFMAKARYVLVGVLSALSYFLLIIVFMSLLFILTISTSGKGISSLDASFFTSSVMMHFYMATGLTIVSIFVGGFLGGLLSKLLFGKYLPLHSREFIIGNTRLEDYLSFYFACRWRSFFTIHIFIWFISCILYNLPNIITYIKWEIIGPWFVMFHPVLWGVAFLWFVLIPIGSIVFVLLPLSMFFPLVCLHWVYSIGTSGMNRIGKIIFIILIYLFVGVGAYFLGAIGKIPVNIAIIKVSENGGRVWEILLDKFSRPVAYESRYKYFLEINDVGGADKEVVRAINAYYDLGTNQLKSKVISIANEAFDKALELSDNSPEMEGLIAYAYFYYEVYYMAKEKYESLYKKYPNDLEITRYLSEIYFEMDDKEKLLPLLEKIYQARKDEMTIDEQNGAREYIENLKEKIIHEKQY